MVEKAGQLMARLKRDLSNIPVYRAEGLLVFLKVSPTDSDTLSFSEELGLDGRKHPYGLYPPWRQSGLVSCWPLTEWTRGRDIIGDYDMPSNTGTFDNELVLADTEEVGSDSIMMTTGEGTGVSWHRYYLNVGSSRLRSSGFQVRLIESALTLSCRLAVFRLTSADYYADIGSCGEFQQQNLLS